MIQYGCSSAFTNKNSKACSIFMKKCSVSTFFTLFPASGSLCPPSECSKNSLRGYMNLAFFALRAKKAQNVENVVFLRHFPLSGSGPQNI